MALETTKSGGGKRQDNARSQLLKKREQARQKKAGLAASELVDDAFTRGAASAGNWLRNHLGVLQWVAIGATAAGIGYGVYAYRAGRRVEAASADLMQAIEDERGRISDKTEGASAADEGNEPGRVFKSLDERQHVALDAYRAARTKAPGTGPALLARLGEAGVLLDKHDWDGALTAYREVKGSKLAAADVDVRGRALEGIGYALEGKGDIDGALSAFHELEGTDARGLRELGMYHQARLLLARNKEGDREKAKGFLRTAHEHLQNANGPSAAYSYSFLQNQVDDLLRKVDPQALATAASPALSLPGAGGEGTGAVSTEQLKKLQAELQKKIKEAQQKAEKGLPNEAPPVPLPVGSAGPAGSPAPAPVGSSGRATGAGSTPGGSPAP